MLNYLQGKNDPYCESYMILINAMSGQSEKYINVTLALCFRQGRFGPQLAGKVWRETKCYVVRRDI